MSDFGDVPALLYRYARAVDTKDWELYRSVFTEDAYIDYSSAGFAVGSVEEVVAQFEAGFGAIPWSMHYITNIEVLASGSVGRERSDQVDRIGDAATVRAMFYNPMQLPGAPEVSSCGGYYHHELVRTPDGWRSRRLVEENVWFVNPLTAHSREGN